MINKSQKTWCLPCPYEWMNMEYMNICMIIVEETGYQGHGSQKTSKFKTTVLQFMLQLPNLRTLHWQKSKLYTVCFYKLSLIATAPHTVHALTRTHWRLESNRWTLCGKCTNTNFFFIFLGLAMRKTLWALIWFLTRRTCNEWTFSRLRHLNNPLPVPRFT